MTVIQAEFRTDPSLAILGGRVEPLEPSDIGLGMRQFSQRTQIRSYDLLSKFMIGCNFAVNRKVFEAVGPFDTGLGRGTQIDSGEDRDFLYRALKKGFKIVYSPNMLVYHGHGRHTEKEIQNCRKSYAKGRGAFYCKQIMGGDRVILRKAVSEIFHLSKKSLWYGTEDVRRTKPLKVLCHLTFGAFYQFRQGMRSQRE